MPGLDDLDDLDDRLERLAALFDEHSESAFNVAWRIVWSIPDAEDVVQTTFLRAFTRLDQLRDAERARPWILQIAYRAALDVVRRRREVPTDPVAFTERRSRDDVAATVIDRDLAERLQAAIDGLPETLQLAFVLRDVEGLSTREVAETLGISLSAAKMRVGRAREQLRIALRDHLGDADSQTTAWERRP